MPSYAAHKLEQRTRLVVSALKGAAHVAARANDISGANSAVLRLSQMVIDVSRRVASCYQTPSVFIPVLPGDVLVSICRSLSFNDLHALAQTCRLLRRRLGGTLLCHSLDLNDRSSDPRRQRLFRTLLRRVSQVDESFSMNLDQHTWAESSIAFWSESIQMALPHVSRLYIRLHKARSAGTTSLEAAQRLLDALSSQAPHLLHFEIRFPKPTATRMRHKYHPILQAEWEPSLGNNAPSLRTCIFQNVSLPTISSMALRTVTSFDYSIIRARIRRPVIEHIALLMPCLVRLGLKFRAYDVDPYDTAERPGPVQGLTALRNLRLHFLVGDQNVCETFPLDSLDCLSIRGPITLELLSRVLPIRVDTALVTSTVMLLRTVHIPSSRPKQVVLDRHAYVNGLHESLSLILAPHSHTLRYLAISEGEWPERLLDRTALVAIEVLHIQLAACTAYTDLLYDWSGIFSLSATCKWPMPRLRELHITGPSPETCTWLATARRDAFASANRFPPSTRPTPHLRTLDKATFSRLLQCRTGHAFTGEYYRAINKPERGLACTCGVPLQTRDHILVGCPELERFRAPLYKVSPLLVVADLLGTREGLAATAKFIQTSGAFTKPPGEDAAPADD